MDESSVIDSILLESRTIAVVGLSDKPDRPSYAVARYLQAHGYRIVPVNPALTEVLGERSYPDLASIPDPVDVVDIFRRAEDVPPVVEAAIAKGAKAVWMQEGIVNEAAAERARSAGLQVVMNLCMKKEHEKRARQARDGGSRQDASGGWGGAVVGGGASVGAARGGTAMTWVGLEGNPPGRASWFRVSIKPNTPTTIHANTKTTPTIANPTNNPRFAGRAAAEGGTAGGAAGRSALTAGAAASDDGGAGCAVGETGLPHASQKRISGANGAPQCSQNKD